MSDYMKTMISGIQEWVRKKYVDEAIAAAVSNINA